MVSVDPDDYPQSDECGLPVAGVNIGKLVGGRGIVARCPGAGRHSDVYPSCPWRHRSPPPPSTYTLQYYNEAMKMVAAAGADTRASPAEERRVLFETGMQVVESLALVKS